MFCFWSATVLVIFWLCTARNVLGDDLHDCVLHIIRQHFPPGCVCFFVDGRNDSDTFGRLIADVAESMPVYVVNTAEGEVVRGVQITPVKPFPCNYVMELPQVGWNMSGYLGGGYRQGDYNLSQSRYVVVAKEHHTVEEAGQVLQELFSYGFLDVDLVSPGTSQVDIFTLYPFGKNFKSCPEWSRVVDTLAFWRNGSLVENSPLFPPKLPLVFNGCAWNISCSYFTPYIILGTSVVYKTPHFTGQLRGYDAGPLSMLMDHLNLTPKWTIHIRDFWFTPRNGSVYGAIPDLTMGRGAQMCCGGLYQNTWASFNADPLHFHTWASMTWFVAAPDRVPKWIMIFVALEIRVWTTVIAATLIVPIIYWIFCRMTKSQKSLGQVFLALTSLEVSNSACAAPRTSVLRIVLVSWLFYTLHIDQFYLASLTRLITNTEFEPTIKTMDDLLDHNLPTAGYVYTIQGMNLNTDPKILKLLDNHVLLTRQLDYHLNEMSLYKNFTIVDNQVFVKYSVTLMNNVSVYPTNVKLNERPMSAHMLRHNYLFNRLNWLLLRMFDAGFPVYFLKRTVPDRFWKDPNDSTAKAFNLRDLSGPFLLLIHGLLLATLAFAGEFVYFHRSRIFRRHKNIRTVD